MATPVMASTIASLIQNIVYLVFNLSFHCTSGKPPYEPSGKPPYGPSEYQDHGHSHNQCLFNQRESHNEININNNQSNQVKNERHITSKKKSSNIKNTND